MKLKWENEGLKTPLARARGLGTAHSGTAHWIALRVSAIALIPLTFWLIWSVLSLAGADYATFRAWLDNPFNAIGAVLFLAAGFYHAALGCREIVEDYVHAEGMKIATLIALNLLFFAAASAGVFSVLKVAFASGM